MEFDICPNTNGGEPISRFTAALLGTITNWSGQEMAEDEKHCGSTVTGMAGFSADQALIRDNELFLFLILQGIADNVPSRVFYFPEEITLCGNYERLHHHKIYFSIGTMFDLHFI